MKCILFVIDIPDNFIFPSLEASEAWRAIEECLLQCATRNKQVARLNRGSWLIPLDVGLASIGECIYRAKNGGLAYRYLEIETNAEWRID